MIDEVKVLRKRVIVSPLWIMPIAAAIISIWMIVNGHLNSGDDIKIEFESSVGIVAGKTPLMYRGMEVGKVTEISIAENRPDRVLIALRLKKGAEDLAKEGAAFWIVRPKIGVQEISNLDTLLTGAYIAVKPPSLDANNLLRLPKRNYFIGRTVSPSDDPCTDCSILTFTSSSKSNLKEGSGIFYRDFKVGHVSSIQLDHKLDKIIFKATIDSKFSSLLAHPIYLWKQKALDVDYSTNNLSIELAPLTGVLEGRIELGVLFDGKPNASEVLRLYSSDVEGKKEMMRLTGGKVVSFIIADNSSIKEASPIIYKQMQIGELDRFQLAKDGINITLQGYIYPRFSHLINKRSVFYTQSAAQIDTANFNLKLAAPERLMRGGIELMHATDDIDYGRSTRYPIYNSKAEAEQFLIGQRPGLRVILSANKKRSIEVGSPVLFRQFPVGDVEWIKLLPNGKQLQIGIYIQKEYQHLVQLGSKFWSASGVQASLSLSSGLKLQTESLKSIVAGGISFATLAQDTSAKAKNGEQYILHEKADEKWSD